MKIITLKKIFILLIFGLLMGSCKNQNSNDTPKETEDSELTQPISAEFENEEGDRDLLNKIENYILTEYLSERDLRSMSKDQRKFQISKIDLNGDGENEIFVNFVTSYFCGSGGCSIVLLNAEIEPITKFTVMQPPLYVEDFTENGWKILKIHSEGKWRKLVYENGSYPSNPSLATETDPPSDQSAILFKDSEAKTYTF